MIHVFQSWFVQINLEKYFNEPVFWNTFFYLHKINKWSIVQEKQKTALEDFFAFPTNNWPCQTKFEIVISSVKRLENQTYVIGKGTVRIDLLSLYLPQFKFKSKKFRNYS